MPAFPPFHHVFLTAFHLKNTYRSQRKQKSLISVVSELEGLKTLLRASVSSSTDERIGAGGFSSLYLLLIFSELRAFCEISQITVQHAVMRGPALPFLADSAVKLAM